MLTIFCFNVVKMNHRIERAQIRTVVFYTAMSTSNFEETQSCKNKEYDKIYNAIDALDIDLGEYFDEHKLATMSEMEKTMYANKVRNHLILVELGRQNVYMAVLV